MGDGTPELRGGGVGIAAAAILVSVLVHGALYGTLSRTPKPEPKKDDPIEFVVVHTPPPPPPEKIVEPPAPEPEPEQPKPPPKKIAKLPPPPNQPPPPEPPPPEAKPPPVKIGISLSSTSQGGNFAVGVGNTLYGKPDDKAADPNAVKPYAATETKKAPFVPVTRLTARPKLLSKLEKIPYPPEATRAGVEGQVILLVTIDETGKVTKVKVLDGPGYGLNEAAAKAARQWRFAPATYQGEPVSTEDRITYTFLLD